MESQLSERLECLPLLEAAVQAFEWDFSWVENDYEDEGKKKTNRLKWIFKEISEYLR